jgi:hypothetical protein
MGVKVLRPYGIKVYMQYQGNELKKCNTVQIYDTACLNDIKTAQQ